MKWVNHLLPGTLLCLLCFMIPAESDARQDRLRLNPVSVQPVTYPHLTQTRSLSYNLTPESEISCQFEKEEEGFLDRIALQGKNGCPTPSTPDLVRSQPSHMRTGPDDFQSLPDSRDVLNPADFMNPGGSLYSRAGGSPYRTSRLFSQPDTLAENDSEFPTPRSVLFKSLMIPGWGQIENRQIWKVPLIYGMFAGVGIYTAYLNNSYKDYRAAYYNSHQGEENDFKFGPTPDYLVGINPGQLQSNRNSFRNQRDFMFIVMGLAYGLNALDAYIFAHMRSFDVSDDLSASTHIGPAILDGQNPGISVRIQIY